MKRLARRARQVISVIALLAVLLLAALAIVRECAPEWELPIRPSAAQWVKKNGSWLASGTHRAELEALADKLMQEYAERAIKLPVAKFSNGGRELPVHRLPPKFRERGGGFGEPQVFVRLDSQSSPTVLVISWGHMRRSVFVFREPPAKPPRGSSVRQVGSRVFVIAYEIPDPQTCKVQHECDGGKPQHSSTAEQQE